MEETMSLSKRSLETLLDLVEIKLSCIEVFDREDQRERHSLEAARKELTALIPQRAAAKATPRSVMRAQHYGHPSLPARTGFGRPCQARRQ
jgi:hypothetical protein